jgi:hypothetical protein
MTFIVPALRVRSHRLVVLRCIALGCIVGVSLTTCGESQGAGPTTGSLPREVTVDLREAAVSSRRKA